MKMNDVQTPWRSFPAVNMSSKRWLLVARSTWLSESDHCAWCLGVIERRRTHPPKTVWDRMLSAAIESDVDPLDKEAFEAFQRAWVEANEIDAKPNILQRWAFVPSEDD